MRDLTLFSLFSRRQERLSAVPSPEGWRLLREVRNWPTTTPTSLRFRPQRGRDLSAERATC